MLHFSDFAQFVFLITLHAKLGLLHGLQKQKGITATFWQREEKEVYYIYSMMLYKMCI